MAKGASSTNLLMPVAAFIVFSLMTGTVACSSSSQGGSQTPVDPSPSVSATPPLPGTVAYTTDDAIRLAAPYFSGHGPPLVVAQPESVFYVETTVGEARNLFDPGRVIKAWATSDDLPAWAIVAYGWFQAKQAPGLGAPPPATFTAVWVVVPMGRSGIYGEPSNEHYNLNQLGAPVAAPSAWANPVCRPSCITVAKYVGEEPEHHNFAWALIIAGAFAIPLAVLGSAYIGRRRD